MARWPSSPKVDLITTDGGRDVLANLQRKAEQADQMFESLMQHMNHAINLDRRNQFTINMEVPAWLS